MSDGKEKGASGAKQLMAAVTKLQTDLTEMKVVLDKHVETQRMNEIANADWRIEVETKLSALVSGRKTTTTRPKKEASTAGAGGGGDGESNATPVGNKTYGTSMAYFKGEYSQNKDTFRAFFTTEALEELDEHMKTITKKGEAK